MFKNPFSFNGRIRRREYILSFLGFILYTQLVGVFIGILIGMQVISFPGKYQLKLMLYFGCIPALYVFIAQSVKRCHDMGNSGWWIFIPFYSILLLFLEGDTSENRHGKNPKVPLKSIDPFDVEAQHNQVIYNWQIVEPIDDVDEDGIIRDKKL